VGFAGQAGASDKIPNSGQDGINDTVVGGGSDTTYVMENDLAKLYNESPGCTTNNTSGSPQLGQCLAAPNSAPTAAQNTNWDHEIVTNAYPTGSSAGIAGLGSKFDFARSSRVASASELLTNSAWGFAKDGIVMATPPGRSVSNLTKAQIIGIYNGSITNWNQIPGQAAGTIRAYGMNSASGTYATFKAYLGIEPNATGATPGAGSALQNGTFPFENDFKPILADVTARGWNASDVIWWGSFGELKTYGYKAQNASFWQVDGVTASASTIRTNSYGIRRFLYRITPISSVQVAGGNAADQILVTTGNTSGGKGGAVRRFTEFTCQPTAYFDAAGVNTALNPFFGTNYFGLITAIINESGFQRTPAAERTAGACIVNS
jgi:ABC-type phosphate transport system substrate-binding protein